MKQNTKENLSPIDKKFEMIPKRLYLYITNKFEEEDDSNHYFNIDEMLQYIPFHHDFGPLKISCVYKYIYQLDKQLKKPENRKKIFWHITSTDHKKYLNSIFLICAFQVVVFGKTAVQAYSAFASYPLSGFRDSLAGKSVYECSIIDCLKALQKAIELKWFNIEEFSFQKYTFYQRIENGDINQIIKDKIYALCSPVHQQKDRFGKKLNSVGSVTSRLKQLGVQAVIHLMVHNQFYDALTKQGIESYFLPFPQNTSPDLEIVQRFFVLISQMPKNKKIAVYCKTGLGKTGTMIGCYAIKYYNFSASQYIGWARLCRPGSVVGHQHNFLIQYEKLLNKQIKFSSQKKIEQSKNKSSIVKYSSCFQNSPKQKQKEKDKYKQASKQVNKGSQLSKKLLEEDKGISEKIKQLASKMSRQQVSKNPELGLRKLKSLIQ